MRKILCVAEKPSIAKTLSKALQETFNGKLTYLDSASKYNSVFSITGKFLDRPAEIIITSVTGHIKNCGFDPHYKKWQTIDPFVLLKEAPIRIKDADDKIDVIKNLMECSKSATDLFLWLDCDREGEAIAYEVIEVCQRNNPNLNILRAQFSSLATEQLASAFANPLEPNSNLNEAVKTRQELDLRSGAALTRFQTLTLQGEFPGTFNGLLISYGSCQFPTLHFVVERFLNHIGFLNSKFWTLALSIKVNNEEIDLNWDRVRLFDEHIVSVLQELIGEAKTAKVVSVQTKTQKRSKPIPLTTIELQKLCSTKLKLDSDVTMEIAEKLYTQGYISYPRTETDCYDSSFDFKSIIKVLKKVDAYKDYCEKLEGKGYFWKPKEGKRDDKAHPPIHPVKEMKGDSHSLEFEVYDLISRHFLANCSPDAVIETSQVCVNYGEEFFFGNGLRIIENNFIDIYSKYYQIQEKTIPKMEEGQTIEIKSFKQAEGSTTPPKLLSESELISLMDKHKIGTDSTIHDHIRTIQERKFAEKKKGVFRPTQLGIAMLETYKHLDIGLANPANRAKTERNLSLIAQGVKTREEVLEEGLNEIETAYKRLLDEKNEFINKFRQTFKEHFKLSKLEIASDSPKSDKASLDKLPITHNLCKCGKGHDVMIRSPKTSKIFIGCSTFPKCSNLAAFKIDWESFELGNVDCENCNSKTIIASKTEDEKHIKQTMCLSAGNCPNSYLNFIRSKESAKPSKKIEYDAKSKRAFSYKKTAKPE